MILSRTTQWRIKNGTHQRRVVSENKEERKIEKERRREKERTGRERAKNGISNE